MSYVEELLKAPLSKNMRSDPPTVSSTDPVRARAIPIFSEDSIDSFSVAETQNMYDKMMKFYGRALEKAESEVRMRYPDLKCEALLMEGRPSATIVEEAEQRDVNLIMMGSRGLGGVSGWLLGSTSRKVVDQCTKPILIIK